MNIKVEEILMVIVAFIIGYFLNGIINQNLVEGRVGSNDGVNARKSKAEKAEKSKAEKAKISLNYTKHQFHKIVKSIYSSLDEISQHCTPVRSIDMIDMARDVLLHDLEQIKDKLIKSNQYNFEKVCEIHG
jgi:uncharacterized protein YacL